jgi:hypothetical protein
MLWIPCVLPVIRLSRSRANVLLCSNLGEMLYRFCFCCNCWYVCSYKVLLSWVLMLELHYPPQNHTNTNGFFSSYIQLTNTADSYAMEIVLPVFAIIGSMRFGKLVHLVEGQNQITAGGQFDLFNSCTFSGSLPWFNFILEVHLLTSTFSFSLQQYTLIFGFLLAVCSWSYWGCAADVRWNASVGCVLSFYFYAENKIMDIFL